jgi:uncharacterized membrane protein (DUF4010 family)
VIAGDVAAERFGLLLVLSLFFGFAFEEFYAGDMPLRPGGVRTFPLLAMAGGILFLIEPHFGSAFVAGLIVVGAWTFAYVRRSVDDREPVEGLFIVPVCNLLAYVLGAMALTQPLWLCVAVAVGAVLLLSSKRMLHGWAQQVPGEEIVTLGKFLILVGVVLPLLYGRPPIPYTTLTPFSVWLAVVTVSTISYTAYLLQKYVFRTRGVVVMAILGGLYSSTAATVALAHRARAQGATPEIQAGIIAATAMMYLRILIVCAVFSAALARALAIPFLVLTAIAAILAWSFSRSTEQTQAQTTAPNPLQIGTALIFAVLLVIVSALTQLGLRWIGSGAVYGLAAIVGITDIDPFVLGIAQGGAGVMSINVAALAVAIAASSNNLLKAGYAVAFSRRRESFRPAMTLAGLSVLGIAIVALALR